MFIKFTRLDNSPIWINASFVVTVEPGRNGGSVVVPIGDGLDYDVKESPEAVLGMLAGAPAPQVVPVKVSDGLTKTPDDVSPDPEPREPEPVPAPAAPAKPVRKTTRTRKTKTAAAEKASAEEDKPAGAEASADDAEKPVRKARTTRKKKPELDLAEEQVARLRKMVPGTLKKLRNTLVTQFKTADADATIAALAAHGVLALEGEHVNWLASDVV